LDQSKILITGATGQLGKALKAKYPNAIAVSSDDLDITDRKAVENFNWDKVSTILNAAGYTNVDGAETPDGKKIAWLVNDEAVGNLTSIAKEKDLLLVHISTDYVFDGKIKIHTEDEEVRPLGVYGQTKATGDKRVKLIPKHYLLRTSWLIGDGANFARAILSAAANRNELKVVSDQFGRPTFTDELTKIIDFLLSTKAPYGTYNASNGGDTVNWADFARAIIKEAGLRTNVVDITAKEYFAGKISSERPTYSTFDLSKLESLGYKPRDWRESLREYVKKELAT
jgi:dTDP-4-dehydrorhamnose reductase